MVLLENLLHEGGFFKDREGLGFLASADEARWNAELAVDCHGDAAFARAVEFGDDKSVERAGLVKFLCLLEGVASGGGIDDEQRKVWGAFVLLGYGAADFSQLLHQVVAGVDASGRIADEKLGAVGDGFLMRVEADRRGIGIRIAGDHRNIESIAPALELLDRGGAKGVGCGEQH
ncbi:MAG: hypothetical protein RIR37_313 [Verrucomicrobiota bacterium]